MEWTDLLSGAASVAGGGIFGLVGSLFGGVFKYFKAKQEQQFKREEWAQENALLELNMKAKAAEAEQELAVVSQAGSWKALEASVGRVKAAGESYRWVNAIKDLYRPALATLLLVVVYLIFKDLLKALTGEDAALGAVFTGAEAKEILTYIVYSVVFSGATAWTWWFADRAFAPPGLKNR